MDPSGAGNTEIIKLQKKLEEKRKLKSTINLKLLPDKGKKIDDLINQLECDIAELSLDNNSTNGSTNNDHLQSVSSARHEDISNAKNKVSENLNSMIEINVAKISQTETKKFVQEKKPDYLFEHGNKLTKPEVQKKNEYQKIKSSASILSDVSVPQNESTKDAACEVGTTVLTKVIPASNKHTLKPSIDASVMPDITSLLSKNLYLDDPSSVFNNDSTVLETKKTTKPINTASEARQVLSQALTGNSATTQATTGSSATTQTTTGCSATTQATTGSSITTQAITSSSDTTQAVIGSSGTTQATTGNSATTQAITGSSATMQAITRSNDTIQVIARSSASTGAIPKQKISILNHVSRELQPSFSALSETVPKSFDSFQDMVKKSPAFKTYQDESRPWGIKYTDPKPLSEMQRQTLKASQRVFTHSNDHAVSDKKVKKLQESLVTMPDNIVDAEAPCHLISCLLPHQITGLTWMMWREGQSPSGGILADDMGLGKTLTVISLILKQIENKNVAKKSSVSTAATLIVCPASIIHQWDHEITKHCRVAALRTLVYHGPKRKDNANFMHCDAVITTYSILQSERKAMREKGTSSDLFRLTWERVVLDEAHTIKNHSSQTAEAAYGLKSYKKWCITGTPIHNDIKDLYSLIKFLKFSPFDDYKKWKALASDNTDSSIKRRDLLVKSILLRRTKSDSDNLDRPIVEMVGKKTILSFLELSADEMAIYDKLQLKVHDLADRCLKRKSVGTSGKLLVLLLRLQQCCSHISLLGKEAKDTDSDSVSDLSLDLSGLKIDESVDSRDVSISDMSLNLGQFESNSLYDENVKSTKIKRLFEELKKISKEDPLIKSVIVSQWVSMLDLVAFHLDKDNIQYHVISGKTKLEDRQSAMLNFNNNSEGPKIMLLSLKAGGVGLNLVGGSRLFLLDLHWNPALELQACDRVHRVGQKRNVVIFKFLCRNTIEEKIFRLQEQKSSLAKDVLKGGAKVKGLTIEDFKMLFNIKF